MIPGLPRAAVASDLYLASDAADVDVFALLGSPAAPVSFRVYVLSGVTISATDQSGPAMDFTGFASGTTCVLSNAGTIKGAGGDGGRGIEGADGTGGAAGPYVGGGGGGGAGASVGAGGAATASATAGSNGTSTTGGDAGENGDAGSNVGYTAAEDGEDGGDAIVAGNVTLSIANSGGIIAGGGGGGAGGDFVVGAAPVYTPGAGGDLGEDGEDNTPSSGSGASQFGGSAGYAVRGSSVSFLSGGSAPNVIGTVG